MEPQPRSSSQALSAVPKRDGGGAAPAAPGWQLPQAQNGGSGADPANLNTGIKIKQVSPCFICLQLATPCVFFV